MRTIRWSWSSCLLILALVLGCASSEGVAQEDSPRKKKPASAPAAKKKGDEPKAKKKKDEGDPTKYRVTVTDKSRAVDGSASKPFVVTNAVVFVPEVTLFGGGSGNEVKQIKVRRGSADVTVPFSRILKLEFGEAEEDRLTLTVTLRGVEGAEAKLTGTVKASLELRGKLGSTKLDSVVRLRDTKSVEFAAQPKK